MTIHGEEKSFASSCSASKMLLYNPKSCQIEEYSQIFQSSLIPEIFCSGSVLSNRELNKSHKKTVLFKKSNALINCLMMRKNLIHRQIIHYFFNIQFIFFGFEYEFCILRNFVFRSNPGNPLVSPFSANSYNFGLFFLQNSRVASMYNKWNLSFPIISAI